MTALRIAAIQMCSTEDREQNLDQARGLMQKAVQQGAQILALPENFSFMGGEGKKLGVAEDPETGASVRFLSEFAAENRVAVVGGSVPLRTTRGDRVSNSCLVFDPSGQVAARYDKIHLFDVSIDRDNTHRESQYVEPGRRAVTVDLFDHTLGLSICYDLRFPELYRTLALRGAQVLFVPAAFTVPTGRDHWEVLLRARAIENQCYVVAPAQFGQHTPLRKTYGRTMVIGPWGQVLAQCQDMADVIVCQIDLDYLDDVRQRLPSLSHVRHDLLLP